MIPQLSNNGYPGLGPRPHDVRAKNLVRKTIKRMIASVMEVGNIFWTYHERRRTGSQSCSGWIMTAEEEVVQESVGSTGQNISLVSTSSE